MAVVATHQLSQCISAHAWNASLTMIAVCQNSNEVHIYKGTPAATSNWERVHVLQKSFRLRLRNYPDCHPRLTPEMYRILRLEHDQLVSGIDWAPISNYIVTCSHDRNSYVWSFDGSQWQPTLVILRLNRAAISVDWSPKENKFVVGSGAKSVCVCYYEPDNNWWVSKIIRKKHSSTVTGAAWHPNNLLIATTSTDGKCRVFCAYIKGVDSKINPGSTFADTKFGEQLLQLDVAVGWTFGVKWSPSGNSLAYVGHDSTVQIVTNVVGGSPSIQTVKLRQLPLRDVLFLSETRLVGGGFDCNPVLFEIDKNGVWIFVRFLDEAKAAVDIKSSTLEGTQLIVRIVLSSGRLLGSLLYSNMDMEFLEAMGRFHGQTKRGTNDAIEPSRANGYAHDNCITCIVPLVPPGKQTVEAFSTSGMDGRVVIWSFGNIQEILSRLEI